MNGKNSATVGNLIAACSCLVVVCLGLSGLIYNAYSKGQEVQDVHIKEVKETANKNTDNMNKVKLHINSIQKDIGFINTNIEETRDVQKQILEKLNTAPAFPTKDPISPR